MPSFNSQIKVISSVKTKSPYMAAVGCNFLAATKSEVTHSTITCSGYQNNTWNHTFSVCGTNFLVSSAYEEAYSSVTISGWQSNVWTHNLSVVSCNSLFYKPTGVFQPISRITIDVKDIKKTKTEQVKSSSSTRYQRSNLNDSEAYVDFDNSVKIVDSVLLLSWRGTNTSQNDFVVIEYNDGYGWKDVFESMNFIVAENGNDYVTPYLEWQVVDPEDDGEEISYELVVALDGKLEEVIFEAKNIESGSFQVPYENRLQVGVVYYWAVRTIDSYGGVSEYSKPSSFMTYQWNPSFIQIVGGVERLLIPFGDYEYAWYTGNLNDGMYSYAITKYNSLTGQLTPIVSKNMGGRNFIVDHSASNPPIVVNASYDPQRYVLRFGVKLYDSQFRKYNLRSVHYANQRPKETGESPAVFDLNAHDWRQIPIFELAGKKRDMGSMPFLSEANTLIWRQDGKDPQKEYKYDLQISSSPVAFIKRFKFAFRNRYNSGELADWNIQDFDESLTKWWSKNIYPIDQTYLLDYATEKQYYGKANKNSIIMNLTKFDAPIEAGMQNVFDFRIFESDVDQPLIEKIGIRQQALVQPKEFYDAGITNILVDLADIEDEYYELYPAEIAKIKKQHKNLSFYWQVRVNDGINKSPWSKSERSEEMNIHYFEWYVRNDDNFDSSDFYVLKVETELSAEYRKYEHPRFEWMAQVNTEIEQYYAQILSLELDMPKLSQALKSQSLSYIEYLKSRVFLVRLRAFEYLLSQGLIENPISYYNQNVHNKPVLLGGKRTSDLDFDINSRMSEKEIAADKENWSSTFSKVRIDSKPSFDSQAGKPLREMKAVGRTCKNSKFLKCFLLTGDPNSCPWIGKMCPGFSVPIEKLTQVQPGGSLDSPGVTYPLIPPERWGDFFDPGDCQMQGGRPCVKHEVLEYNMQEHTCEVCSEPRYYQFMPVSNAGGYSIIDDYYSQINPAGFAGVQVVGESVAWGKIASRGQTLKVKPSFMSIELMKSQLPGELHSDVLDYKNNKPIVNPYFVEPVNSVADMLDMSQSAETWTATPSGSDSKFHIVEVI